MNFVDLSLPLEELSYIRKSLVLYNIVYFNYTFMIQKFVNSHTHFNYIDELFYLTTIFCHSSFKEKIRRNIYDKNINYYRPFFREIIGTLLNNYTNFTIPSGYKLHNNKLKKPFKKLIYTEPFVS